MPKRKFIENEDQPQNEEEERYFLNPDSVSQHLYCSVCQDVFTEPQRAPCGHSFCKKCITAWLKQSKTCPEDRKPVDMRQLHHDFILENIIGDQMVACPYRRSGCLFIGQLQMLKSHKKGCEFNPVNLPEFLKNDDSPLLSESPPRNSTFTDTTTAVPSPGKPSLKMRLFRAGGNQKRLLSAMFDKDTNS